MTEWEEEAEWAWSWIVEVRGLDFAVRDSLRAWTGKDFPDLDLNDAKRLRERLIGNEGPSAAATAWEFVRARDKK